MHIAFLTHYYPPEVNAPATRTHDNAKRWVRQPGVSVTIITNNPHHPHGRLYPGYQNRLWRQEIIDGVKVIRVKTCLAANAGVLRRTLSFMFYMLLATVVSMFIKRPDVVVATSPQFFCALAGFMVSRLRRRPFVFELRDLWPESIAAVGAMRKGLLLRLIEKVELFLYNKAAMVVVLTQAFSRNLISRGCDPKKIHLVTNGVDLEYFSPRSRPEKLANQLSLGDKYVVSYIGTIGMAHGLETVVGAAELLKDDPEVAFIILGDGARRNYIKNLVSAKGLTNCLVLPGVGKKEVLDYYALSNVVLVTLRDQPLFHTVLPSKIFEIMAMGKAMIITVPGECKQVVEQAKAGIFAPPENPELLAATVMHLKKHPRVPEILGANGRGYVAEKYDRNKLSQVYLQLLERVHMA